MRSRYFPDGRDLIGNLQVLKLEIQPLELQIEFFRILSQVLIM